MSKCWDELMNNLQHLTSLQVLNLSYNNVHLKEQHAKLAKVVENNISLQKLYYLGHRLTLHDARIFLRSVEFSTTLFVFQFDQH